MEKKNYKKPIRFKTFITLETDVINEVKRLAHEQDLTVSKKIERIILGKDKHIDINSNNKGIL